MNVLQVTTHLNIGGIGNYILTLSAALKSKGVNVVVVSSGGNLEPELRKYGIKHIKVDIDTKFEFGPKVLFSIPKLCEIITDEKIDIIHAHTRVSQVACRFASGKTKIPYVTTCHGFFKKRFRGIFDTWGARVIAISDHVKTHLEDDLGVAGPRIKVIYNGIDAGRFSVEYSEDQVREIKKSLGLDGGPVIGTIGRLSSVKGHKFLIEAMAGVLQSKPDALLMIIGDGEEQTALKKLAGQLGIGSSVHFIKSAIDTHRFLSLMDVFVFPSLKEGLGIALLEALACRRACVASEIGGIKDIITDNVNGVLVGSGDPAAIRDAVLLLLDNRELRKNMGDAGRRLVNDKFTLGAMADKVLKLYEEVLR